MSSSNIFGGSDDRPSTPPELQKFRRSAQDVGKRYVHPESKPCGKRSDPPDKNTAKSVIHSKPQTITEKINTMKAEMNSKQPKLGKSQDLGSLPTDFDHVRGITTKGSEAAKDVVNPQPKEDPMKGHELYRVSHGSYLPGEQKIRNYDWTVDPNNVRFGKKSELVGFNGISLGVTEALSGSKDEGVVSSKALEDYRDMGNTLGRRRNRGLVDSSLPPSHSYGLPTGQDGWDAAKVLKGSYDDREQLPDADLGKTLTPGFRNISMDDRAFGVPSIRSDLKKNTRSIADSQAYGDEPAARELVQPAPFSDLAIPSDAFVAGKSKEYLVKLFDNIGFGLKDEVADVVFDVAADGEDVASIANFKAVLNEYWIAMENGKEKQWLRAKRGHK